MLRFMVESTALVYMRCVLGDEATADILFEFNYDGNFVKRHPQPS